ncbi:serine/threonine-protein kinase GG21441 isoform X2 [Venturia canescens]|uniref:serine/threonine-protein kinase GG21441 isoform X2 n=1 Tax=Venturia canescens TaxID=32260 RepID=UPI001C9CA6D2|nr:serine/threonine-protein kinase GG21441 isoform X2 [Venturia canescens]
MEEPSSGGASPSRDSINSIDPETGNLSLGSSLDRGLADGTSKISLGLPRTPLTNKAKRVRFFRNGDKFYTGVVMAVTPERYRNFDSLASDLTRALVSSVTLPNGVRSIYTMDGRKVQTVGDLEDGKCYVVSGQGEAFKKVEYSASKVGRGSSLSGLPQSPAGTGRQISAIPACVKARIVTIVRNGSKPRKVVRLLLNKRNSPSIDHVFEAITDVAKLDSGAVRRVCTISGRPVITLEQFFESDDIFVAYGLEKANPEDFELDSEESKFVQSFRRGPWISKRQSGPMPVMPRKAGKRNPNAPQVRTPSPSSLILPQPLRFQYAVGHVIGDGNFSVVRHCIHKATGAEYAMKIVDKYKCKGKETMLASEVAILRQVCHPNIISLIGEQETVDQLFLVIELVKGGDLFDAISAATKFPEAEASVMISHLTSALAYLHSHQIVHRDVKPENLLVELEGSRVRCLKLGDFGLAQVVHETLYTVCGTPTYVAPEILAESGYGLKIDVWAAGVILYILLCGFPPFISLENDQEELFERILSGQYEFTAPYWDHVSDSAKQLISNMLQAQPELRFSAEDVLDHPWLVRFLGGDQTVSGGGAAIESSKQHRNKQCQPLRLATFEFDYKKRRFDAGDRCDNENVYNSNDFVKKIEVETGWVDVKEKVSKNKKTVENSNVEDYRNLDEIDNGNRDNGEEPLSLSADGLRDIRDLTSSLHDLVINIDENHGNGTSSEETNRTGREDNSTAHLESPLSSSNKHSVNRRNGNSLTNLHSKPSTETKDSDELKIGNELHCNTPKTGKRTNDRTPRVKRTIFCKIGNFVRNGSNGSSSNEREHKTTGGDISVDRSEPENSETRRSIGTINNRQIKPPNEYHFSKTLRPSLIPVQSNGQTRNSVRGVELSRIPIIDGVKLREKKNVAGTTPTSHLKKSIRAARRSALENVRRCSSTDELRDEQQELNTAKTKRFSLYYTPQPARKNYETDNKISRTISKTSNSTGSRPTSWKTPEPSKKMADDISRINGQKDSYRNRKSVVESSTVASRNKSSRQTVHTRNSYLPTGRTK